MTKTRQKLLWISGVLIILGLTFGLVVQLIRPKSVSKIDLSEFENETTAAQSVGLILSEELKKVSFFAVVIDSSNTFQAQFAQQFISVLKSKNPQELKTFTEPNLASILSLPGDTSQRNQSFWREIRERLGRTQGSVVGGQTLFVLNNQQDLQKLREFIKEQFPESNVLSIIARGFPRKSEDEAKFFACDPNQKNHQSTLDCILLKKARVAYRKKKTPGKWIGMLDQVGLFQYVFMIAQEH